MIFYFNNNRNKKEEEINPSMIEIFTNFFEIEIHFHTKMGKEFQLEVIKTKRKADLTDVITIVLISNNFDEQEENTQKEQSFSEISSIYGNWSYYILLNYPQMQQKEDGNKNTLTKKSTASDRFIGLRRRQTLTIDYPELFPIDEEKSQISKISMQNSSFN
jgi:hypothetical protein